MADLRWLKSLSLLSILLILGSVFYMPKLVLDHNPHRMATQQVSAIFSTTVDLEGHGHSHEVWQDNTSVTEFHLHTHDAADHSHNLASIQFSSIFEINNTDRGCIEYLCLYLPPYIDPSKKPPIDTVLFS